MPQNEFHAALDDLLDLVGLAPSAGRLVEFRGPGDPMIRTRYRMARFGASAFAAAGVAAAQLWALRTGRVQQVTVDTREAAVALRGSAYMKIDGKVPPRERDPMFGFYQLGSGRWFMLHCNFEHLRQGAARALRVPATHPAVSAAFRGWSGNPQVLETSIMEAGGCGAFVRTPDEWSLTPQAAAARTIPLVEIERIGDAPVEPLPEGSMPLSGIRVLDLTRVIAGPSGSRLLAECGADVLKVTRADLQGSGTTDIDTGIGKLATHIDLRDATQCETMRGLVRTGDVFFQSYRTGTLDRYGLGAHDLARLRPGIIHVSLNAWGHAGPWRHRRGFDTVVQAASGMAHIHAIDGVPSFQSVSALDYVSGALMALGTMAALRRRAVEGGSWAVRTSLAGSMQWLVSMGLLNQSDCDAGPKDFDPEVVTRMYRSKESVLGQIDYLGSPIGLSETPLGALRPPVPLGYDEPRWPDRPAAA